MIVWRKSSRSGGSSTQSDCVELAGFPSGVGVRDSKAPHHGHLVLSPKAFATLAERLRASTAER
ncbi:DUF397 domain-containing protein [Actinomadura parmotrematis]|uniref:DUF397 domain-containing protein n=1 Tax=Actinomadura parmotrematis TaxID=2864039 RepID=A0ABS7FQD2_9ACTN|nr:DUF397 domain-containing protein [Actinomadura parmotrematis]MBW8481959.1 DUF397 domain-containing protein [Actinomadura parmotrematis]